MGVILICKRFRSAFMGTYFWVKWLSSFLNVFIQVMMSTILNPPLTEVLLSFTFFVLDQYFCLVAFSLWQQKKEIEGIIDVAISDEEDP